MPDPASMPAAIPSVSRCADAPSMTVLLVLIGGGGAWHLFGMLAMYSAFVSAAGNTITLHKQHLNSWLHLLDDPARLTIFDKRSILLLASCMLDSYRRNGSRAHGLWLHACFTQTEKVTAEHTASGFMHADSLDREDEALQSYLYKYICFLHLQYAQF